MIIIRYVYFKRVSQKNDKNKDFNFFLIKFLSELNRFYAVI